MFEEHIPKELDTEQMISSIKKNLKIYGISIAKVCRQANVTDKTFQNWKKGNTGSVNKINQFLSTYHRIIEDAKLSKAEEEKAKIRKRAV